MSLTFNQFQKELQNRGIDGQVAYMLSILYEQHVEVLKQVDMMSTVLNSLADTVGSVVELHHNTGAQLKQLNRLVTGEMDGVHVSTEPGKGA